MMNVISVAFLLLCLGYEAFSLDCYTCQDCSRPEGTPTECTNIIASSLAECFKEIEEDGTINRGCTNSATCLTKEADPRIGVCVDEDNKPCFSCCDDVDNCNAASMTTVSMATIVAALCVFVGIFRF